MFNRREFLGMSLGAGATLAFTSDLLRAFEQQGGKLIQRAIPSSGEMLPVIGLHRGSRPADPAALKEVLKTLVDNGGRFVDTVHGGAQAQDGAGRPRPSSAFRTSFSGRRPCPRRETRPP